VAADHAALERQALLVEEVQPQLLQVLVVVVV
jgi:hypothetical protein